MGDRLSLSDGGAALLGAAVTPHFEAGLTVPRHSPGSIEHHTVAALRDRIANVTENCFPGFRPIRVQWSSYNDPVRCQFSCENHEAARDLPLLMSRLSLDLGVAVAGSAVIFKRTMLDEPVQLVLILAQLHGIPVAEISGNRVALTVARPQEGAESFDGAVVAALPLPVQFINQTGDSGCFFDRPPRKVVNATTKWPGKSEIEASLNAKQRSPMPPPGYRRIAGRPSFADLTRLLEECGASADANGSGHSRAPTNGATAPEVTPLKILVRNTGLIFESGQFHQLMATVELVKNRTPSYQFILDLEAAKKELEIRLGTCPAIMTKGSGQIDCVVVPAGYPKEKLTVIRRILGQDVQIRFPAAVA